MFVAMSVDVLKRQANSSGAKVAWILVFFFALPIGAVFYYLTVFRRVGHLVVE
jgi:hypothetical protein